MLTDESLAPREQAVDDAEAQPEAGEDQEARQQHHRIGPVEAGEQGLRRVLENVLADQRQENPVAEDDDENAEDQPLEPAPGARQLIVDQPEEGAPQTAPEDAVSEKRYAGERSVAEWPHRPWRRANHPDCSERR